jgi:hypothetical protein
VLQTVKVLEILTSRGEFTHWEWGRI